MTNMPPVPSGIYAIRNTVSGRVYVGSAICIASRWNGHRYRLRKGIHHSKTMQQSWLKHGPDAFTWEVLERVPDLKDLTIREQHWMDLLHAACAKRGFNSRPRAESSGPMSEKTKALLRAQHLGKKLTDQHRAAISAAGMGRKGKPCPPERKAQLAAAKLGKPLSPETKAKLSAAFRGRKLSPEATEKVRANLKLRLAQSIETLQRHRPDLKGRKQSAEHRAKNRDAQLGKKHTPEAKARMRAVALARETRKRAEGAGSKGKKRAPFTAEHCARISAAKAGRKLSDEHRAKITEAVRRKHPMRGLKHSDTTKALMSEKAKLREAKKRLIAEQGSLDL
jgi:group I intron endonuclease